MPPPEILTSFLPPAMGFIKSEWCFSYGYGWATALSALSLLKRTPITPNNPIFLYHAMALIFYGLRLNIFLFIRNRISSRMQEFQKRIEERAQKRGSRLARTPIVLSSGLLYYCLYFHLIRINQESLITQKHLPPTSRWYLLYQCLFHRQCRVSW